MKVLVLNASLEPLHVCDWRRAVVLLLKDKAELVANHSKMLCGNIPMPKVIRLRRYVRVPYAPPAVNRHNVLHRDDHTCQYCGARGRRLTVDHVVPRSRGGSSAWTNVVACCNRCNEYKGDRTPEQAGLTLRRQPYRPGNRLAFEISKYAHLRDWWARFKAQ